jgi:hypothetical protein
MGISKSQYPGTLKTSTCGICLRNLDHLTAERQEMHLEECKKQRRLC